MTIEELLNKARTDLERKMIELAYLMGKVDGKQEALDIIIDIYEENGDE